MKILILTILIYILLKLIFYGLFETESRYYYKTTWDGRAKKEEGIKRQYHIVGLKKRKPNKKTRKNTNKKNKEV